MTDASDPPPPQEGEGQPDRRSQTGCRGSRGTPRRRDGSLPDGSACWPRSVRGTWAPLPTRTRPGIPKWTRWSFARATPRKASSIRDHSEDCAVKWSDASKERIIQTPLRSVARSDRIIAVDQTPLCMAARPSPMIDSEYPDDSSHWRKLAEEFGLEPETPSPSRSLPPPPASERRQVRNLGGSEKNRLPGQSRLGGRSPRRSRDQVHRAAVAAGLRRKETSPPEPTAQAPRMRRASAGLCRGRSPGSFSSSWPPSSSPGCRGRNRGRAGRKWGIDRRGNGRGRQTQAPPARSGTWSRPARHGRRSGRARRDAGGRQPRRRRNTRRPPRWRTTTRMPPCTRTGPCRPGRN